MTSREVAGTAARAAAEASVFLCDRSAENLGWPDLSCVARYLAAAVLGGLTSREYGDDPQGWCVETLTPAIERRLSGSAGDLRAIGWPHTPTVAATVVGWLVEDGLIGN